MELQRPSHPLFDFFGTLVDYSSSRTAQGYPRSHALLGEFGSALDQSVHDLAGLLAPAPVSR